MKPSSALWIVTAILFSTPVVAQAPVHTVRGVVRDSAGTPVSGAEVLLESSKRATVTDASGQFRLEGVPDGVQRLLIRRIGFAPARPRVRVPQDPGDSLLVLVHRVPQMLPPIVVESKLGGIRGTVGDTGLRPIPGAIVQVLGGRVADTTDAGGKFGFDDLGPGHYMLRVSRPGYIARLLSVGFSKKGQEYAIILDAFDPAYRDWGSGNQAPGALRDLSTRLSFEPRRTRMTRTELARYGSMPLCDIRQIQVIGPNILVHGSDVSVSPDLCTWSADEVEMVEWGESYCREAAKTVAYRLGDFTCTARTLPRIGPPDRRIPPRGWVVVWPRN